MQQGTFEDDQRPTTIKVTDATQIDNEYEDLEDKIIFVLLGG